MVADKSSQVMISSVRGGMGSGKSQVRVLLLTPKTKSGEKKGKKKQGGNTSIYKVSNVWTRKTTAKNEAMPHC